MKETYCDVCGKKCDNLGEQDRVRLAYPKDENFSEVLVLEDICWDCRLRIATDIMDKMVEKKTVA